MNLKEHQSLQTLVGLLILTMTVWTLYEYMTGGVYSWSLNLGTVIILLLISNGLLLEHKFTQLRNEIIQSKVEYGLQTGKNLKEGLDDET